MIDFHFHPGRLPLLISMPHVGTDIPAAIAARLTPAALLRTDTDWHLRQLYRPAQERGASLLAARWSRYVIDLNRAPEDSNLYPGRDTTSLCPLDTFARAPLYLAGQAPGAPEVQQRLRQYWQPYHLQLQTELARLLQLHGAVVLWDAHSIASVVPRFFDGKLPDLNFGSADGASCALPFQTQMLAVAQAQPNFSVVLNGRFKGGYITRQYGRPASQIHALQLELCQCLYMDEAAPYAYRPDLAPPLQALLAQLLAAAVRWVQP